MKSVGIVAFLAGSAGVLMFCGCRSRVIETKGTLAEANHPISQVSGTGKFGTTRSSSNAQGVTENVSDANQPVSGSAASPRPYLNQTGDKSPPVSIASKDNSAEIAERALNAQSQLSMRMNEISSEIKRTSVTLRNGRGNLVMVDLLRQILSDSLAYYQNDFIVSVAHLEKKKRMVGDPDFGSALRKLAESQHAVYLDLDTQFRALREAILAKRQEIAILQLQNQISEKQLALSEKQHEFNYSKRNADGAEGLIGAGDLYKQQLSLSEDQNALESMRLKFQQDAEARKFDSFAKVASFLGKRATRPLSSSISAEGAKFLKEYAK